MDISLTADSYVSWKKELLKLFKEWDKNYVKHVKGSYGEMRDYHELCMRPFNDLG